MNLLHVGCGNEKAPKAFEAYTETRYDIDPRVNPDVVGSILDIPLDSNSYDALFCSNNLEHVFEHEVPKVLSEFKRVVRPGGIVIIVVPDLQAIAHYIVDGDLDAVVYNSPAGDIRVCDMLWGYGPYISYGNHFMAHKFGFTQKTLRKALNNAGLTGGRVYTMPDKSIVAQVRVQK